MRKERVVKCYQTKYKNGFPVNKIMWMSFIIVYFVQNENEFHEIIFEKL